MAQLDAFPTGDQKVAGSTPSGMATFFREDWPWNIFTVILSLPLIQERQFLAKECAQYCLTANRGLSKSVVK